MATEDRQELLLAKAQAAEGQAEKTRDSDSRVEWLKMAEAYRQLAKTASKSTL